MWMRLGPSLMLPPKERMVKTPRKTRKRGECLFLMFVRLLKLNGEATVWQGDLIIALAMRFESGRGQVDFPRDVETHRMQSI
mmetsp:Transcript_57781/g.122934  ORF Transcript_57781/g.122934 Transcript_57781/m.122934 type:complete len:82 (-) Transcript_57781:16-261(-)